MNTSAPESGESMVGLPGPEPTREPDKSFSPDIYTKYIFKNGREYNYASMYSYCFGLESVMFIY